MFKITDSFFGHYQKLVKDIVIPYQEKVLRDEAEGAERSSAIENFRLAGETLRTGEKNDFYGMVFQDSDVAKWIEAAAYSLRNSPDSELEARCDDIIELIGNAQHADGYLNTYFTLKEPGRQWTNLAEAHELYCAGHMIEAAVAYAECTGKTKLLSIMERMTDNIYMQFITNKAQGYPGHPEIELALMRLYGYTKNPKHLELAGHFINVRGVNPDYFEQEAKQRNWHVWIPEGFDPKYAQNHKPVREQKDAVGHSVRAVYLYTGMCMYASETGDKQLMQACENLWNSITQKRMYITGGIGSAYENESFTEDYHLPNDTAYAETCASIGLVFFARAMLAVHKHGKYADVMERALYNTVLAGMQLDGTRFFYVNPLEVIPGISGVAKTHRHALPERPYWFACACCPPNTARLLASIGDYAWSVENDVVYSHLFISGIFGNIEVTTDFPNSGKVTYKFKTDTNKTLALRLPSWSENTLIDCNYEVTDGYAYIKREFKMGDTVNVELDMSVKRNYSSLAVAGNSGRVAFTRGPLVLCAEGTDNNGDVLSLAVKHDGIIEGLTIEGYRLQDDGKLYTTSRLQKEAVSVRLTPYYTWGNRGLMQMRVWLPEI